MNPGRLREQVTIRRSLGQQQNPETGGYSDQWQDGPSVRAEALGLTGREATIGQSLQGISVYRITMRYREDVSDSDQLRYRGRDLNIRSVADPDGRREVLVIIADTASAQAGT